MLVYQLYKKTFSIMLLFIALTPTFAQQLPQGRFLAESISVGLPVKYALSFKHHAKAEVFFPDTTYNFKPFRCIERAYFTTKTDEKGSLDSVVYTLVSFEINPIQHLSLPIYIQTTKDCTAYYTEIDSVKMRQMVKNPLIEVKFRSATNVLPLVQEINYPLILLGILITIVLGVVINWLFGETINRQLNLLKLLQRHADFNRSFQRIAKDALGGKTVHENLEKALILWKQYIERLEQKPYSSMTTREITDNIPNEDLAEALKEIDLTIYGGTPSSNIIKALDSLKKIANMLYEQKRIEVKNVNMQTVNTSLQ
jgi:hypothetical protein